ncbi:MAG: serine/threonine-protein kinase, partial [Myxococcales bacterium]|nr:serine/threonine protein kinase [Polyangiaceae bacterium]MDW8249943.1 serine/threonine-protein kinase [Myxococcales bacterium]
SQRYRVDALLAFGGMGAVYRGEHVLLRKRVAIKVLQEGAQDLPQLVERFRREAIVGANVSHPNIASATDFGQLEDGSYFLVMEHIKGKMLYDLMKEEGALPVDRAMGIARQVAAGLAAAHEVGVVHRDIKPHNVMLVDLDGNRTASIPALLLGRDIVKIIDFGFAKLAEERLSIAPSERSSRVPERITQQGEIFGTIAYLAPEAAMGMDMVDARSDLYALGVVIYQMLTGLHPFQETAPGPLFRCHLSKPPPSFAERAPGVEVPAAVEALTLKLLEKDPARRFQSALELIEAIDDAMGIRGMVALAPGRISTPSLPSDLLASTFPQEAEVVSSRQGPSSGREPELSSAPEPLSASSPSSLGGASTSTSTSATSPVLLPEGEAARGSATPAAPPAPSRAWLGGVLVGVALAGGVGMFAISQGHLHLSQVVASGQPNTAPLEPLEPARSAQSTPVVLVPLPAPSASEASTVGVASAASAPPAEDATPWKIRMKASIHVKDWPNARLSFRKVVELEPAALADPVFLPSVVDLVTNVGQHPSTDADHVFDLLENRAGGAGLDVLYDVVQRRGGTLAATRATEILKKPAVLARASAPLRVAFELRVASCDDKGAVLDRVVAEGDWRALRALEAARSACGSSKAMEDARKKLSARLRR